MSLIIRFSSRGTWDLGLAGSLVFMSMPEAVRRLEDQADQAGRTVKKACGIYSVVISMNRY